MNRFNFSSVIDLEQLAEKIDRADKSIEKVARENEACRRLVAMYGTGSVAPEQPGAYHRPPGSEEETLFGGGPVLVPGAPFRRRLPDREIDLYPVRYFSAILNPRENLVIHTAPSVAPNRPVELWSSRIDGSQQRKLVDLEPTPPQVNWSGMNWSKDGQWAAFTRGGVPVTAQVDADVWKMRADGSSCRI